jgi:hypothetical protein
MKAPRGTLSQWPAANAGPLPPNTGPCQVRTSNWLVKSHDSRTSSPIIPLAERRAGQDDELLEPDSDLRMGIGPWHTGLPVSSLTIGARHELPVPVVGRLRQDRHMSDSGKVEWAGAKIARAQQHRHDLVGRIAVWSGTSRPRPDASIAADRLSYEVRVRLQHAPPLEEWSLILGDALHNLRSALDVLVWALAEPASLSDAQQRRVMWPVVVDPEKWADAASRSLTSVPADVIERIRQCQPLNRPEPERERDGLLLLHGLDIKDKHRLSLSANVQTTDAAVEHSVEFQDEAAAARNVPPDVTIVSDAPTVDGSTVFSGRTVDPIKKIKGKVDLAVQVGISVGGNFTGVVDLLDGLSGHVMQAIQYVASSPGDAVSEEDPVTMPGRE